WSPVLARPTWTTWSATFSHFRRPPDEHRTRTERGGRADRRGPGVPDRRSRRRVLRTVRLPPHSTEWGRPRLAAHPRLRRRAGRTPAAAVVGALAVPPPAPEITHRVPGRACGGARFAGRVRGAAVARRARHGRRAWLPVPVPALSAGVRRVPRHPNPHVGAHRGPGHRAGCRMGAADGCDGC